MNKRAVEAIHDLWSDMTFHRVKKVVLKPEMLFSGQDHEACTFMSGGVELSTNHCKWVGDKATLKEWFDQYIAGTLSPYKEVSFHDFYGFTDDGVYFHHADYSHLDLTHDVTLRYSKYGNENTYIPPTEGQIVCGTVKQTPKGKRFEKWFMLTEPQYNFMQLILTGNAKNLTIKQVAKATLTDGHPDSLFAILLLVLFDDVSWFSGKPISHPCAGMPYGKKYFNGGRFKIDEGTTYLSIGCNYHEFVHNMSLNCGTDWWDRLKEITIHPVTKHHGLGAWCRACAAEDTSLYSDRYDAFYP